MELAVEKGLVPKDIEVGRFTGLPKKIIRKMIEKADQTILTESPELMMDAIESVIKIKPFKGGTGGYELIFLKLIQQDFVREYWTQRSVRLAVRIIVEKGRRCGLTTIAAAICALENMIYPNWFSAFYADRQGATASEIYDQVYFPMIDHMEVAPIYNDTLKQVGGIGYTLTYNGSRLRIGYETKTIGVRFDFLHITEAAYFTDLEQFLGHILHAIAADGVNFVLIESTARAFGDGYHQQWDKAEKGESVFKPMFFPWFRDEDSSAEFADDDHKREFLSEITTGKHPTYGNENELVEKYGVTPKQLLWRRNKIMMTGLPNFYREYPSTPEEAFLQASANVFDVASLKYFKDNARPPEFTGDFFIKEIRHQSVAPTLYPAHPGLVHIWDTPSPESEYVIGVDTSEGQHDFSVAICLQRMPLKLVAILRGFDEFNIQPIEFANHLYHFANYYQTAPLAIESNNAGLTVITHLTNLGYWNIMAMEDMFPNTQGGESKTEQLGWRSTGSKDGSGTKRDMLERLKFVIANRQIDIPDEMTISELSNFIEVRRNQERIGKLQAAKKGQVRAPGQSEIGFYDDRIVALGSALVGHQGMADPRTPRQLQIDRELTDHGVLARYQDKTLQKEYDPTAMDYDVQDFIGVPNPNPYLV